MRTYRSLRLSLVLTALLPLSGCGLLNINNLTAPDTTGGSVPSYTGNWEFDGIASTTGALPTPVVSMSGAIANTGAAFTATFRLLTTNACVDPTQDINFTGTRSSVGIVTMNSTNLTANPITITLLASPTDNSLGIGTYTITGSGACAMAATNFSADFFQPLTGTYAGSVTMDKVTANAKAVLTQATANADGQFPETGTMTVVTPTCTDTFVVGGYVSGQLAILSLNQVGPPVAVGGVAAKIPDDASQITTPAGLTIVSTCNPGVFTGTLTKQ